MSGKIEPVGNADGSSIVLKGGDNGEKTDFSDIVLGTDYRELSKFIVFPGSETHPVTKFAMNVTFGIYVNGTLSGNTVTKTATVTPPRNKTVFEAGKKYNVNITVDDALTIELIYMELTR